MKDILPTGFVSNMEMLRIGFFFISKKAFVKDKMEQGSCLKHET